MYKSLEGLEKSNYHLHLTGSLPPPEIRNINAQLGSDNGYDQLDQYVEFDKSELWAAAKETTSHPEGLELAIGYIVLKELETSVNYVELTINTFGMIKRGLDKERLAQCLQNSACFAANLGSVLKIKFGVNRKDGPGSVDPVLASYFACPKEIRGGIDLNGDEHRYPTKSFVDPFLELSKAGISTSIHAGEFSHMTKSLDQALDAEPKRIAHAVAAGSSETLLDRLNAQRTIVEVSLTSNLMRRVITDIHKHPVNLFLEADIPIVMGTDDPGFFNNSMCDELKLLEKIGISRNNVKKLNSKMNDLRQV